MGLHVALTNRRGGITDPELRSRGHLCVQALRYALTHAAVDLSHKLRQTIREQNERTRKISI